MKKFLTFALVVGTTLSLVAQTNIRVWVNGRIDYEQTIENIDSITFSKHANTPDPPTPVDPPTTEVIPNGYVRILIQVPDGEECNGIYMKGTLDASEWSTENTYIGLETAAADPENAIRFERIADGSNFFSALFKLGSYGLWGAVCQRYTNDAVWQGKSRKVKLIEDSTTLEGAQDLELPQFYIPAGTKPGILALKIGGWENSECVRTNDAGKAIFTMMSKVALPEGTTVGITGVNLEGKANWEHDNPIIMTKQSDGSYQAINNVRANCVYSYFIRFQDEYCFCAQHGHIIDGFWESLYMPVSLQPVDTVDGWTNFDKHYRADGFDKTAHSFGIIGSWNWASDKYALTYVADEGDYIVTEAANVEVETGTLFKIRENGDWNVNFGYNDVTITGDANNFEMADDNNFKAIAAAKYKKITFKFKWNGSRTTDRIVIFTK